jgi:hypothetical protein
MIDIVFEDQVDGVTTFIPLIVDAAPEQNHRANAMATENEVERGADITDHYRAERRLVSLKVVISDTPIAPTPDLGGSLQATSIERPGGQPIRVSVYTPSSAPTRVADSWRILMAARDRGLPAIVTTRLDTYTDVVLLECQVNTTARDGTWIVVDLTFGQIRTVATQEVEARRVPARVRDRPPADDGSREGLPVRLQSGAAASLDEVRNAFREGRVPFLGGSGG